MLRGWREIEAYTRLSRDRLSKYRKLEGCPIQRWGRHVVLVPESLGTWLITREKYQIARRARRAASTSPA
jgi:hypothetical protein